MSEINYNFSSIYIVLLAILYKIFTMDFSYFTPILNNIYQFNSTSIFIVLNVLGLVILLTKIEIQINFKISIE